MPTYDYRCDECGHTFEEFQSMSAKPLRKCPHCKKAKLKRLIGTGAAVIFKGGGFWQTDYRSENYKAGAKAEAEASKPATETKSESKSETATKSESTAKSDAAPAPAAKNEPAKPAAKAGKSEKKGK